MSLLILPADGERSLELAVDTLAAGDVVAFPTDTVYGIGAHGFLPNAVEALYRVKGRPAQQPLPLLLPDLSSMNLICTRIPAVAWALAERFWPGGLSLVLWRQDVVPDIVVAGGATVAVRVPASDLVRRMASCLGAPIAATSANIHGEPAPVRAAQVALSMQGRIRLLLDGGACPRGMASTVVDLTQEPAVILRQGPVTKPEIVQVVPTLFG